MPINSDSSAKPVLMTQDLGGVTLPYLSYDGDGPTMILLHATGFLHWLWHPIARELSPSYRVIAPYICDYRKADADKGGLHWLTVATDIAAFCERNHIENPYLVGHSMGGTVLTMANVLYGVKAKGMILIEPIFLHEDFYNAHMSVKDHPLASKALKRTNHWKNRRDAMDYLRSRALFKSWTEELLNLYITYGMKEKNGGGLELVCSPETEAALFMGGVQYNPWPLLPEVSCPVLVIEGETSDSKIFINITRIVSSFPDATHFIVKGAGHLVPMEQPSTTATIIRNFFNGIPL